MFSVENRSSKVVLPTVLLQVCRQKQPVHPVSVKTELKDIRGYQTLSWSGECHFTSCSPPVTLVFSLSVVQLSALVGGAAEIAQKKPGDAGLSWERDVLLRQ